jgi:hypothetical protein
MLIGGLSEANNGTWKVVEMCGKAMEIFLDHLYTGSVKEVIEADIGVFTELLNASDKVLQTIFPTHTICTLFKHDIF